MSTLKVPLLELGWLRVVSTNETGKLPYGALVKKNWTKNNVINDVVELVKLPNRNPFEFPVIGNVFGTVAWLEAT